MQYILQVNLYFHKDKKVKSWSIICDYNDSMTSDDNT